MRWLVTGGCGFIGLALLATLLRETAHRVRIVDNLSVGTLDDLSEVSPFVRISKSALREGREEGRKALDRDSPRVEFVKGDILDETLILSATRGIDVLVHLAANTGVASSVANPRLDCMTNVIGTLNCLEGARRNAVKRFVFASSGAPVGECEPPIHEEVAPHPVSPYGASKLAGEGYCSAYFRTFGLEAVVLRFGNVYGPGSVHKNSVVAKFIKQAIRNEQVEIYGDGSQTRDFIYIDDLVEAIVAAATLPNIGGEIFQIATNRETSVQEIVQQLSQILSSHGIQLKTTLGQPRLGDVRRSYSNTEKARLRLNWMASTPLATGLEKTVQAYLAKAR